MTRTTRITAALLIAAIFLWACGGSSSDQTPTPESTPTPEQTVEPEVTAEPNATQTTDTMMERAEEIAVSRGLETIAEPPVTQWMTMGEWLTELGLGGGREDPDTPVFVAAYRGTGTWSGAAGPGPYDPELLALDGVTFAIHGINGNSLGAIGGYNPPPYEPKRDYLQVLNNATHTALTHDPIATAAPLP